jgi:MinD-like ATPase involved in chromosome partitioning or flagellar assembly
VSVIALAAGKGSRGVTTAALALAAVWPARQRVLLAECDPSGGSLAMRFRLRPTPGLVSLGSVGRRSLGVEDVWSHVQTLPGGDGLEVLLAPVHAEQSLALGRLWAALPGALAGLDADVVADCGRLAPGSPAEPLLHAADLVVLVCTPTPEGVLQLQGRIQALTTRGVQPHVLLVGERPYGVREIQGLLDAETPAEVAGALAYDERAAALLDGRPGSERQFARSLLLRSAREAAERLFALTARPSSQRSAPPASLDDPVEVRQ